MTDPLGPLRLLMVTLTFVDDLVLRAEQRYRRSIPQTICHALPTARTEFIPGNLVFTIVCPHSCDGSCRIAPPRSAPLGKHGRLIQETQRCHAKNNAPGPLRTDHESN